MRRCDDATMRRNAIFNREFLLKRLRFQTAQTSDGLDINRYKFVTLLSSLLTLCLTFFALPPPASIFPLFHILYSLFLYCTSYPTSPAVLLQSVCSSTSLLLFYSSFPNALPCYSPFFDTLSLLFFFIFNTLLLLLYSCI